MAAARMVRPKRGAPLVLCPQHLVALWRAASVAAHLMEPRGPVWGAGVWRRVWACPKDSWLGKYWLAAPSARSGIGRPRPSLRLA